MLESADDGDELGRSPSKMSHPETKEMPDDGGSSLSIPHGVSSSHQKMKKNDAALEKGRAYPGPG